MNWWPFGNKFSKLKREEVVNAICSLQAQEEALENGVEEKSYQINTLIERGRVESSREKRIFYAQKIKIMKEERQNEMQQALFLLYNISLLNKLKSAIDDNNFVKVNKSLPLNKLLTDQKGLAVFLNKALNTKLRNEEIMTGADDVFKDVKSVYSPHTEIYGADDDSFLDVFNEPIPVNAYNPPVRKAAAGSNEIEEEIFEDRKLWN
jgi:hypothetical protein